MSLKKRKLAVDAILFDLDGTLIDSAPIYYDIIDVIFKRLGIPPVPQSILNKKPHAEPLVMCSDKLGIAPGKCIYVGDTRVDIKAGNAAGMRTVAVLTGFDDYDALDRETPNAIIESVADLKAILGFESLAEYRRLHNPISSHGN